MVIRGGPRKADWSLWAAYAATWFAIGAWAVAMARGVSYLARG